MAGVGAARRTSAVSVAITVHPIIHARAILNIFLPSLPPYVRCAGFAVFFAIFDVTRRCAIETKTISQDLVDHTPESTDQRFRSIRKHTPRVVHATTLVTGGAIAGLAYEMVCRPWDAARKAVHIDRLAPKGDQHSIAAIISRKVREDGVLSFFGNPAHPPHEPSASPMRRRANAALRTLGRVGPWGVGFLVWEAFGPGIS